MTRIRMLSRCVALSMTLMIAAMPSYAAVTSEQNTDRPGSDFSDFSLPGADPQSCAIACADDAKCNAYTYVRPGVQGPAARCYLKSSVPAAQRNDCCVSGVKTATPTSRVMPTSQATPTSRAMPARNPPAVTPAGIVEAPMQMQDAAVAQGAARQWATQAFVQPAPSGFGSTKPRYGQMISQNWVVRFSVVNPLIGEISVDITCFNSAGSPIEVEHATVSEANGGSFQSGPLIVKGRAARLIKVNTRANIETWCRAMSAKPFLFSASRASYELMANPDGDNKMRFSETPIETFVLMK